MAAKQTEKLEFPELGATCSLAPAHRGGGPKNVWDFGGYGLWQAWVMRVPTILVFKRLLHVSKILFNRIPNLTSLQGIYGNKYY